MNKQLWKNTLINCTWKSGPTHFTLICHYFKNISGNSFPFSSPYRFLYFTVLTRLSSANLMSLAEPINKEGEAEGWADEINREKKPCKYQLSSPHASGTALLISFSEKRKEWRRPEEDCVDEYANGAGTGDAWNASTRWSQRVFNSEQVPGPRAPTRVGQVHLSGLVARLQLHSGTCVFTVLRIATRNLFLMHSGYHKLTRRFVLVFVSVFL